MSVGTKATLLAHRRTDVPAAIPKTYAGAAPPAADVTTVGLVSATFARHRHYDGRRCPLRVSLKSRHLADLNPVTEPERHSGRGRRAHRSVLTVYNAEMTAERCAGSPSRKCSGSHYRNDTSEKLHLELIQVQCLIKMEKKESQFYHSLVFLTLLITLRLDCLQGRRNI